MKRNFLIVTGLVTVVAILFINASADKFGMGVGDYASDFDLPNIDGQNVSLADYKDNKGFIVVFTCNTCPYAKMYEQRVMDLDVKYASKGFPVIAINPNDVGQQPGDSMSEMQARARDRGYTFPYLRDDSQEIASRYGAAKTPHVYVLNEESEGKYRIEFIGAIDDSPRDASDVEKTYVEDAINALLAGEKPKVTSARAIGCTIKWKES